MVSDAATVRTNSSSRYWCSKFSGLVNFVKQVKISIKIFTVAFNVFSDNFISSPEIVFSFVFRLSKQKNVCTSRHTSLLLLPQLSLHTLMYLGNGLKRHICMCIFLRQKGPTSYQYLWPAKFYICTYDFWAIVEFFFCDGRRLDIAGFLLTMPFISQKKLQILVSPSCGIHQEGGAILI